MILFFVRGGARLNVEGELEVKGSARPLHTVEVVDLGACDIVNFETPGELSTSAHGDVTQPNVMSELRGNDDLVIRGSGAFPAAEKFVNVIAPESEIREVVRANNVTRSKSRLGRAFEVRLVRDPITSKILKLPFLGLIAQVEIVRIEAERRDVPW